MILPVPHVRAMDPYVLADLSAPPGKRLVSFSQNESLRPPSPLAIEAAATSARSQHLYPDPDWTKLRYVLADLHQIDPDLIACGNGSLDLIGCLARAFLDNTCAALAPVHAYPYFRTATISTGARFDTAPESALSVDIAALIAKVRPDTRIVFIANPGNPTSTRIPRTQLIKLRNELPGSVLLVIDEAYGEFSDHMDEPTFDLVERGDTVVLRTVSKAYGLAGARVGWGVFPPEILRALRKILNPNNISVCSQAAAGAALLDQKYMRETCAQTAMLRDRFCDQVRGLGLTVPQSFTNFATIQFDTPAAAHGADQFLRSQGVFLRPQSGAGLPDCLRATVRIADDMALVVKLLEGWKNKEATG